MSESTDSSTNGIVAPVLGNLPGGVSAELLASALAHVSDPVVITCAELRPPGPEIVYVNPAFTELTGYSLDEVRGDTPRILQGRKTDPLMLEKLKRSLREEQHFQGETINYRKDGSEYVLEWEINPIRDSEGVVRYWVALQRDVTERKRLEREVLDISTREQQRIAQDLHDNLGQILSGVLMRFKALRGDVEDEVDSPRIVDEFEDLTGHLKKALDRLRRHVRGLYPVSMAQDGLIPGLEELCSNAEALYGVTCTLQYDRYVTVASSDIATQLYRVTQEAITNSVRHGDADAVHVDLSVTPRRLRLEIRDDGSGIDPDPSEHDSGMGLRIMQHRTRAVGAGLEIRPADDGGTSVVVSLQDPDAFTIEDD